MKIGFDVATTTKKTDRAWQTCVGSDHAFQAHRADWQRALRFIHDELGFKYVRFHGILGDDMNTLQRCSDFIRVPGANKIEYRNFWQVGQVYDAVLAAGMRPFVEITFMPSALASGKATVMHYKGNITLPRSFDAWHDHVKEFTQFLLDRYGQEEVEQWYFEVWNEADLFTFFRGKQKDFFRLYKYTVTAIKEVDDKLRVGGPATSGNKWIPEFRAYCEAEKLPYDFISTHHYPGDAFGQSMGAGMIRHLLKTVRNGAGRSLADINRELFYNPDVFKRIPKGELQRQMQIAKTLAGDKPLFYTEWNNSSVYGAPVHDTKFSAAFAFKTVLDLDGEVGCYSFWNFSDIYEEIFFMAEPFNGAFGLLTIDGIPKPSFWAFKLLSLLGDARHEWHFESGDVEAVAFDKDGALQLAVYKQSTIERSEPEHVEIALKGLTKPDRVTVMKIDEDHCNPLGEWKKIGSPRYLSKEQIETIKQGSTLREEDLLYDYNNSILTLSTNLDVNDICLIAVYTKRP
jgi:xylan 1,4-beta-xylosidase